MINLRFYSANTEEAFKSESFEKIGNILIKDKKEVYDLVKEKIQKQVERELALKSLVQKNTTLYFSLLLESKGFTQRYHEFT